MDILAQNVQLCARFNGGANAGHTLLLGLDEDLWRIWRRVSRGVCHGMSLRSLVLEIVNVSSRTN